MKVFISHSSKDKDRFVLDFAIKLRNQGIDAWLDYWEMSIGDSLVEKIFHEGIKDCDFFIIILSKNSIKSNWVREELEIGVVKKIEKQTKIMPIIIDENVVIPKVLSATVWQKITDLNSYDKELTEIINSILGIKKAPPIGEIPKYAVELSTIGDLSIIDSNVLKLIVEFVLRNDLWTKLLSGIQLKDIWQENGISKDQVEESLEILDNNFYIEIDLTTEGWFGSGFMVTTQAILDYANNYINNFDKKVLTIISNILNKNVMRSDFLSKKSSLNRIIIIALIEEWESSDYIKYTTRLDSLGNIHFQHLSAMGKRFFKEKLGQ